MKLDTHEILQVIEEHTGLTPKEIFANGKKREIVTVRQMFHRLCRKYTLLSFESIGSVGLRYGCKFWDHATILHSCRTIDNLVRFDSDIRQRYETLDKALKYYRGNPVMPSLVIDRVDLLAMTERRTYCTV